MCLLIKMNVGIAAGDFWKFQLRDLFSVLAQILIAISVVYYVNRIIANDVKRREIILNIIEALEDELAAAYSCYIQYTNAPQPQTYWDFMKILKRASRSLTLTLEVGKTTKCDPLVCSANDIKGAFLDMKESWTENIYPEKKTLYAEGYSEAGREKYDILKKKLIECKLAFCK